MGANPIKFIHLRKHELEYEVTIRGEEPESTVAELRKQINRLSKDCPSEEIFDSGLDDEEDIESANLTLTELSSNMPSIKSHAEVERAISYRNHLVMRFSRIKPSSAENIEKLTQKCNDSRINHR